nr:penicillin-binding protein [Xanthovirga aplysinae]
MRIGYIQVAEGKQWEEEQEKFSLQFRKVKAPRGNIYSDNGSLLATSLPFYKVAFDPTIAHKEAFNVGIDSLCFLLSNHFKDQSANSYKRKIRTAREKKRRYIVLNNKRIDYLQKKEMQQWPIFREGRNQGGVIFEKVEQRYRPFGDLARRTIGYLNEEDKGVGIEYSLNEYLKGQDGEALFEKIAGRVWKPVHNSSEIPSKNGLDITTTIDVNLQDVAESALLKTLQRNQADYGCVVVMEVATGEIKAISNLKLNKRGNYSELYNYAVGSQGLTTPGSTMKLASMIALLENTGIKLTDSIDTGNGKYKYFDQTMEDDKPGGYGKLSVADAFAKSSNVAISKLVNDHFSKSPQQFIDELYKMGIGKPFNFQLIGEGVPYINHPSDPNWSGVSLPWMAIGYEVKFTPLQVLTLYNAVANNGKMVKPIIVKEVSEGGKVKATFETEVLNKRVASKGTLKKVRYLLEQVVEKGTARNIKGTHYKIAGKTGTAKKVKNGKYIRSYHTSFAGYFPADEPKYSCIVVIDNPKGFRQYGSDVSAPVFREIADKVYARDIELHDPMPQVANQSDGVFPVIRSGNQKDLQLICNEIGVANHSSSTEEWVKSTIDGNQVNWRSNKIVEKKVPDVRGMTLRDALFLLENEGLKVNWSGRGRVSSQSLTPGGVAKEGRIISINLK